MSCLKNTDTSQVAVTAKHLVKYRQEARKCIEAGSLAELTYCSYVVTISSIIRGESLQMAMRYCRQFCRSFVELTKKQNHTDEWIEMLWRDSLMSLDYVHRDIVLFDCMSNIAPSMEFVLLWEELLDASSCLLVSEDDIANLPISMSTKTEQICHKIKSLSIYMHLSLDQFLFRAKFAENTGKMELARSRLYSVLDRILRLMAYLPSISDYIYRAYKTEPHSGPIDDATASTFLRFAEVHPRGLDVVPLTRDTGLALLYAFSRLLKNLLEPTTNVEEEIIRSATAICRLCANIPIGPLTETLIVKRSLFWAGLILTETRSLPGQSFLYLSDEIAHLWIKNGLRDCILTGHHWRRLEVFDHEEELLNELFRAADNCVSAAEIWKVGTAKASLFHYSNTLATWFFALPLVRFEHRPNLGRVLEIIT